MAFAFRDQGLELTDFTSVTDMLLVVLLVVKIRILFGVLLLSVLLHCLKINHDMLWYKWLMSFYLCILQTTLYNELCASSL